MGLRGLQHVLFETTHDAPFGALVGFSYCDWWERGAKVTIRVFEADIGNIIEIAVHHV